ASFAVLAIATGVAAVGLVIAWRLGAWTQIKRTFSAAGRLGRQVNIGAVAALTLLYWFLQVVVVGLMCWALGIHFAVLDVLARAAVPGLAGMLAPVPGGVGVREAAIVALAAVTDATTATLVTLAIVQRVLLVAALPLALGALRLARRFSVRTA